MGLYHRVERCRDLRRTHFKGVSAFLDDALWCGRPLDRTEETPQVALDVALRGPPIIVRSGRSGEHAVFEVISFFNSANSFVADVFLNRAGILIARTTWIVPPVFTVTSPNLLA